MAFCNKCGNPIPDDKQFCDNCSSGLSSVGEASAKEQPSTPRSVSISIPIERPQLTSLSARRASRNGALIVVGLFAISLVTVFVLSQFGSQSGAAASNNSFSPGALVLASWLTILTVHGALELSGSSSGVSVTAFFGLQPGLFLCAVVAAATLLSYRDERSAVSKSGSSLLIYAALTAAGAAAVTIGLAIAASYNLTNAFGSTAAIQGNIPSIIIGCLLYIGVPAASGRIYAAYRAGALPERISTILRSWKEPFLNTGLFFVTVGAFGIILALLFAFASLASPSSGSVISHIQGTITNFCNLLNSSSTCTSTSTPILLVFGLIELPFILLGSLLFVLGAPLGIALNFTGSSSQVTGAFPITPYSTGIFAAGVSGTEKLLLLLPACGLLATTVRSVLVRAKSSIQWAEVWRSAVIGAVTGGVIAYSLEIQLSASATGGTSSGAGTALIGIDLFGAVVASAIWCAAVPVVSWYAAPALSKLLRACGVSWTAQTVSGPTSSLGDPSTASIATSDVVAPPDHGPGIEPTDNRPGPSPLRVSIDPTAARRARRMALAVLGVVVVVVGVAGVNAAVFNPTAVVKEYFNAVAARNIQGALSYGERPTPSNPLLSQAFLDGPGPVTAITNVDVTHVAQYGNDATATVTYKMNGIPVSATIRLVVVSSVGPLFQTWRLVDPTVPVVIQALPGREMPSNLTVNGVSVSALRQLSMLPGEITRRGGSTNLDTVSLSNGPVIAGVPGTLATVNLHASLSSTAKSAAIASVVGAFQSCLQSTNVTPSGCPFDDSSNTSNYQSVSGVSWSENSGPSSTSAQVSLNSDGTVDVSGNYDVNCAYTYTDIFGNTGTTTDDVTGSYDATVSFSPLSGTAKAVFNNANP